MSHCLSCYDKVPQTGRCINNRNLFSTVLGTGSLRSSGEDPLPGPSLLPVSSRGKLCGASLIRMLISFMRDLPSGLNHLSKAHLLMLLHWALGFGPKYLAGPQTYRPQQHMRRNWREEKFLCSLFPKGQSFYTMGQNSKGQRMKFLSCRLDDRDL